MNTERELTIDELNAVSGGAMFIVLAQMAQAAKDTSGYQDFSGRPPSAACSVRSAPGATLYTPAKLEKITRKTNDASNVATLEHHDALADSELDAVTGGDYGAILAAVAEGPME